ncbi:hypothetical protein ACJIZ3_022321 [Penstemon smallii]|uniref:Treslin N-terminal domain-containing protein n=1 Tax=Penstemon smallii TaxID=265156 RepID=A0ABD3TN00_9LAMI
MAPPNQPPPPSPSPSVALNFSKTQRLVLLIDLHPILTLENPNPYISALSAAAARLIRFPPLSSSLSAYKLFFSSLSPLQSDAVLPRHLSTPSLSFNLSSQTLDSLSTSLNYISSLSDSINSPPQLCEPCEKHVASSLLQLTRDYAWEIDNENLLGKNGLNDEDFVKIRSNLVMLFSPFSSLVECFDVPEFHRVFCAVREALVSRDIHICWIDVLKNAELKIEVVDEKTRDFEDKLVIFKDGIRKLGWGFCSSDLIVLGSALLPMGLIYPKVGVTFDFVDFHGFDKRKCDGTLSLGILDVNGVPIECKCCDLEFVSLQSSRSCVRSNDVINALESRDFLSGEYGQDTILGHFGSGRVKVHVKKVHKYDECDNIEGSSEIVLVRECFQGSEKNRKKDGHDFFAERVLEMLHVEMGGVAYGSELPTWQCFLSFLYLKGYWALVSISSSSGDTIMCSLKPFTSLLAILSNFDAGHISIKAKSGSKLPKIKDQPHDTCAEDMNNSKSCSRSQTETSTSGKCVTNRDGKGKKCRKMTWGSFCEAALGGSNFDLFEVYNSSRQFAQFKKLKFLRSWMKLINQGDPNLVITPPGSKSMEESATCNGLSSEPSQVKEDVMPVSNAETSETFFNNLSERIQHGVESGMDLHNLAERVVKSSVHWLHQKCETASNSEGQQPMRNSDDSCSEAVVGKLFKLLLRNPKEMKKPHQNDDSCTKSSDPCSSSENIVREHEMQIFLRMEILRSDFSVMIEKSRKKKLVKQICSLLEIIQYLVAGGLHGDINLYDYVERTIKARYSDGLEDVVNKIYSELEMDILLFTETPNLLFNNEDSNQSWMDKLETHKMSKNNNSNKSESTEGDSLQILTNENENPQEMRERNRRNVSFTSWVPDLQRVWAPKQPKAVKGKFDSLSKKSKRKDKQRVSYSVVCETPMIGTKRTSSGDEEHDPGNSSYSVSKALFQDI